MRSKLVAVFAGALMVAGLIAGPAAMPRAVAQTSPNFVVNLNVMGSSGMMGGGWGPNASITIDVLDPVTQAHSVYPNPVNTNEFGQFSLPYDLPVKSGDTVTVSDGVSVKTLVVASLTVTAVDLEANTVSGIAGPGDVRITVYTPSGGTLAETTAAHPNSGPWTADFSPYDLVPASGGFASQSDDDGDATWITWNNPRPNFFVSVSNPSSPGLFGNGWGPNAAIAIDVFDPVTQTHSVYPNPVIADAGGSWGLYSSQTSGFTVKAGDTVTVTDGVSVKTLVVASLSVTAVDHIANTVSGTASPGDLRVTLVAPGAPSMPPWAAEITVIHPTSGPWTADFSPYDLLPGSSGFVWQADDDGDQTSIFWNSPPAQASLTPTPDTNLADGQSIALSGSSWLPGTTLYVTECRLDQPLAPGVCDLNTSQSYTVTSQGTVTGSFTVAKNLVTASGAVNCAAAPNRCGLVGVVWPGVPNVGNPIAIDFPGNNVINFSVAPTPMTKDDCKKGGWQSLFDDLGRPFKNQGDCVSYVATGGKNKADG